MDPRVKELSRVLTGYSCDLKKGERVLIDYEGECCKPLVRQLIKDAYKLGARPYVNHRDGAVLREILMEADEDQIEFLNDYQLYHSSDATLSAINRGHTWAETCTAVNRLAERRIAVGLHMIMGLPGESREFMLSEADTLSALPVDFLKLHQLQIVSGSLFAGRYASSPESFVLWRPDDYADFCVDFAERLNPRIIIERFVSQAPRGMVLAPQWDIKNFEFTHLVDSLFLRRDTWQGRALGFGLDSLPA